MDGVDLEKLVVFVLSVGQKFQWCRRLSLNDSHPARWDLQRLDDGFLFKQPWDCLLLSPAEGLPVSSLHGLEHVLDPDPMTVSPDTPLIQVIAEMGQVRPPSSHPSIHLARSPHCDSLPESLEPMRLPAGMPRIPGTESQSSYVLVMQDGALVGLFTDHDLIQLIAAGVDLTQIKVSEVMKPSRITLSASRMQNLFKVSSLFSQYWVRHLPVMDDSGRLVGMVTPDSVRRVLLNAFSGATAADQPLGMVPLVSFLQPLRGIPLTEVIHAAAPAAIADLIRLMATHQVSCVVIRSSSPEPGQDASPPRPLGIVSAQDIVRLVSSHQDLQPVRTVDILRSPLLCLAETDTLWAASFQMSQQHTPEVGVVNSAGDLTGIVTQTNLLMGLSAAHNPTPENQMHQTVARQTIELRYTSQQLQRASYEQDRLQQMVQWQKQKDHCIRQISTLIQTATIHLKSLFQQMAEQIQPLFQVDRAAIYRFHGDWSGSAVAEATRSDLNSLLGFLIHNDLTSGETAIQQYQQGQVRAIADILTADLDASTLELLQFFGVRAKLAVPIFNCQTLWGLLVLHQSTASRPWLESEIEALRQLALLAGIAVHQAENRQSVQQLAADLEFQVSEHANRLKQAMEFEATLKRITNHVRDSLDEDQILQTAVEAVTTTLGVNCCQAVLCQPATPQTSGRKHRTAGRCFQEGVCQTPHPNCAMIYEYAAFHLSRNNAASLAEITGISEQLAQGMSFQFCEMRPYLNRGLEATLICPIFDDQGWLGQLNVFACRSHGYDLQEIQLVQQVANHCAIAIRQARLYQASQEQVRELERLHQMKDDFLSTISHELRTPLSSIKMVTNLLQMGLLRRDNLFPEGSALIGSDKIAQYLRVLQEECDREINLVNDLLAVQRLDAGAQPVSLQPLNVRAWALPILASFQQRMQVSQQSLEIDIPDNLPEWVSDSFILSRILVELLNNACKYTPRDATISISMRVLSAQMQIVVRNTGATIPLEELPRIFDPFYRIPSNDRWKHGGTGLGLALVRKLVTYLGGNIQVNSADNQVPRMRYSAKPGNPSKSSIRQIKLYSVAVKTAVIGIVINQGGIWERPCKSVVRLRPYNPVICCGWLPPVGRCGN